MNTIYDGSYVLGNTNELTFSAGPGIKIDSPSAGTVRIGNDETVLWEAPTTAGQILTDETTLSESMKNFDRVRFYFGSNYNNGQVVEQNNPHGINNYFNFSFAGGDANCWMQYAKFSANDDFSKIKMQYSKAVMYGSFTTTGSVTLSSTTANDLTYVQKIVGLNRISGSNA